MEYFIGAAAGAFLAYVAYEAIQQWVHLNPNNQGDDS